MNSSQLLHFFFVAVVDLINQSLISCGDLLFYDRGFLLRRWLRGLLQILPIEKATPTDARHHSAVGGGDGVCAILRLICGEDGERWEEQINCCRRSRCWCRSDNSVSPTLFKLAAKEGK